MLYNHLQFTTSPPPPPPKDHKFTDCYRSSDLFIKRLVLSPPADGLRSEVARGALLTFDPTRIGEPRNTIVSKFGVDGLSSVQGPDEYVVRLEIPVDYAVAMEVANGKGNLYSRSEHRLRDKRVEFDQKFTEIIMMS